MKSMFSILLYIIIVLIFLLHFLTNLYSLSVAIALTTLIVTMYNIKVISLRRKEDMETRIFIQPHTVKISADERMAIPNKFYIELNVENTGVNSAVNLSIEFKQLDSKKYDFSVVENDENSIHVKQKTTIFPHEFRNFKHRTKHFLPHIFLRVRNLNEAEFTLKHPIKINYFDSNHNKLVQKKTNLLFNIRKYKSNDQYYISIENQPLLLKF
ncbi:hypothetical protein NGC65_10545 [Staphylococcus xylosus]|uniref:hypothetical protein n=1 Tax=Staphylococcus xylosus TaxID=1288 RepID=UPI002DBFFC38|nr:hypothetical protein [Staphylococcus xylosus]MEB7865880.1 hypothetical protein [Staphylococcus xylosus]